MITEDLNEKNLTEQIDNDWKWIREVIGHEGKMYSHSSKVKALSLSHYLGDNQECFNVLLEYAKRRNELIKEINFNDHSSELGLQIDLFA